MATVWKLQGGTVSSATSLAALGLSKLVRIRRSLARDEITFQAEGAAVDSTALFAYGDVVTLTKTIGAGSPVKWFVGVCVEIPRAGYRTGEDTLYRIAGTWWYFENLTYQQNWPITGSSGSRRAMIVAGFSPPADTRQNTKDFMMDVLDWLIASGSGAVTQYTSGNLPTGFNVPFARLTSPTCAEALQHIVRYLPDAAAWFDYTTTPPTFNLKRRSAASSVSYALTALSSVQLTPRNELKVDRLVIQYVTVAAGGGVALAQEVDPGGTTGREFGSVVLTLNNDFAPLASGFAAAYRASLSTLHYSGELTIEEDECSQSVKPGDVVNITSGPSAWSSMNAQVQQVHEDFEAGRTTITVGPAAHLRLDDFFELFKIARGETDQFGGFAEILKTGTTQGRNRVFEGTLSYSGATPTATEIATALAAVYTGSLTPRLGDIIHLTVSSKVKFRAYIHDLSTSTGGGLFIVGVTAGGITKYGHVYQTGIF